MTSSNSSAVRSSAKHAAERIQQHLPPSNPGSLSSSSLNLPARASLIAPGGAPISHSSRPKDRPSSSASSASISASSPSTRRSGTPVRRSQSKDFDDDNDPGRVRVSVRVRPRNGEELKSDADFADLVELQPEIKRLKLRKNNWSSESYRFDEVFTDTSSQKRVYEGVAKPVVEGVLNGYNGTIMAYGQTGTGKTYTVGKIGKDDAAERGIMVRALEDILVSASSASVSVEISYLQLYMETIQDLLAPERSNISINEDAKTGEVSVPGATVVNIQDLDHFLQVLQVGEANRHAANTKMNTESSRSHAILTVYVRRAMHEKAETGTKSRDKEAKPESLGDKGIPRVRKSKLLIVDLAGSERINKSGTDGHLIEEAKFINLSLTSLGKCINALAEGSSHIPTRDSKLTRLLRDSFGGSARTSLIITIGPSARYHAETTSTIMFGQRAMKIVNMVKLKEEFDYESLCRKLETQVDHLTAEVERQNKLRNSEKHELEKRLRECENSFAEAEKNAITRSKFLEKENGRLELRMKELLKDLQLQKDQCDLMRDKAIQLEMNLKNTKQQLETSAYQEKLADASQVYEKKIAELVQKVEDEQARSTNAEHQLEEMKNVLSNQQKSIHEQEMGNYQYQRELAETTYTYESKIAELQKKLEDEHDRSNAAEEQLRQMKRNISDRQVLSQENEETNELRRKLEELTQIYESTVDELQTVKLDYDDLLHQKEKLGEEVRDMKERLLLEEKQRKQMESELSKLKKNLRESEIVVEDKRMKEDLPKGSSESGALTGSQRSQGLKKSLSGQRATMARLCEEVGVQKILHLIKSEDVEVQIQAVKVVANLAAEESNQVKIVEEGGVEALLMLVQSSQNSTILRVASGAIANLAMNEKSQDLIMNKGGAQLLAKMVTKTDDPQTLRMVAGALANLCGNEKFLKLLKEEEGIKGLLTMAQSGNIDIIAQVARGMANFAKCETREIMHGRRKGRSLLLEEGALEWLTSNSHIDSASTQRHIELALCHLAQNEENANDFKRTGSVTEIVRISVESSRDDIRSLAKKILKSNPYFSS
ncbi:kinesin-like protein KIN-UC isoform X2 [Eutrema salsugineum]|uniref:kinesin-like protein KIN-UC isoform X2 n=1 Tax=Eutrema salsugineum TaxID=72664 RepID=UPI000CED0505|nr:kinesin-like protein KIN-UC isoform X2 [Eutrema salsugineum]